MFVDKMTVRGYENAAQKPPTVEDVRYCPDCGCKTWHVDGVCEWSDGHKSKPLEGKS